MTWRKHIWLEVLELMTLSLYSLFMITTTNYSTLVCLEVWFMHWTFKSSLNNKKKKILVSHFSFSVNIELVRQMYMEVYGDTVTQQQYDPAESPLFIILNYFPTLSLSDIQTPPQAPICLWANNQETGDTADSQAFISHPESGWRLQTYPHSTQRDTPLTKRRCCTSQHLKAWPPNTGGGRSLAHITHERAPADNLLTWGHCCQNEGHNPWELLTPLRLDAPPLLRSKEPNQELLFGWVGWSEGTGRGCWDSGDCSQESDVFEDE